MKCVLRTEVTWCKCGFQCAWPSQNAITHSQNVLAIKVSQYKINGQLHNIKQNKHRSKLIIALVQMWSLVLIQFSIKIWRKCRHSQNVPSIKISHCETLNQ